MPTVKCLTFRKGSGHHETCHDRRGYLEKDSRALERTCLNIATPERWDREMDRTREQYRLRGCVSYREFIISPDPSDRAALEQVRELAVRWAHVNFPTAEVAIVFHDDNKERIGSGKEGIVHAHVVVNTVDLETGRKIVIKDRALRELHNSAQRIAEDLKLSTMPLYEPGKRHKSAQKNERTQAERQMEMRGIDTWKSQVRDMALQALSIAGSPAEFREMLAAADVRFELRRGRIYLIDNDNPDRACRADKLDKSLSARNLADTFSERQNLDESREALVAKIKEELVVGDRIHGEMQRYRQRCEVSLEQYRQEAPNHRGTSIDKFPEFKLPPPKTPAEIEQYRQLARAFHHAAEECRRLYAAIPPQDETSPYRHRGLQTGTSSIHRNTQTREHHRSYER